MGSINFNPRINGGSFPNVELNDQTKSMYAPPMLQGASIFSLANSSNSSNSINDFDFSNMGNYDDSSNGGFWKTFLGIFKGPEQANQPDPNADAQKYADEHGMTLDEAKEELRNTYDDPVAPDAQGFQLTGNPDTDAQNYADLKGISLDEAKAELKELYGDPEAPDAQAQGQKAGNPDEDAQRYADVKGITLEEAKAELKGLYDEPEQLNTEA